MLHQRCGDGPIVVKGNDLGQNSRIAGLPHVGAGSGNQPQRIVVEAASDIGISLFGQRLVLVVGAAVRKLGGGDIDNPLPCPVRDQVHKAKEILAGIPKAHAPSDAGLVIGGGAGHVEGHHTLVLIPDVDHAVHLVVGRAYGVSGKEISPVFVQLAKGLLHIGVACVSVKHGIGGLLVNYAVGFPLVILRIFNVAENKHERPRLAWLQDQIDLVGGDGLPAAGHGVGAGSLFHRFRLPGSPVGAEKGLADRVKTVNFTVHGIDRIMIAPLPVLCFVENRRACHLHLSRAVIALEISAVVIRIPQAPFHVGKEGELFWKGGMVCEFELADFAGVAHGNKSQDGCLHLVFGGGKTAVAHAVTAFVGIQTCLNRLPARVPDGFAFPDIEILAVDVCGNVIVTVAGKPQQLCVLVKRIAAAGVGYQAEKVIAAKIVDPGKGRCGGGDHVFAVCVVEITKFHAFFSLFVGTLWCFLF